MPEITQDQTDVLDDLVAKKKSAERQREERAAAVERERARVAALEAEKARLAAHLGPYVDHMASYFDAVRTAKLALDTARAAVPKAHQRYIEEVIAPIQHIERALGRPPTPPPDYLNMLWHLGLSERQ